MTERLFAYGTLRETDVQQYVFGRILDGIADSLQGYVLSQRKMYGRYLVLEPGNLHEDEMEGVAYALSTSELLKADIYEGPAYKRIRLQLKSGCLAWVYVAKEDH
jgi:gamma-glutamylcyclotransferase (GGCT)/AIG2-like uncharacterized protein YtfP